MGQFIDLTGKRFGRLIVIKSSGKGTRGNPPKWLCQCDCGNTCWLNGGRLRAGRINSCGCLRKDRLKKWKEDNKKYNRYNLEGEYGIGWATNTGHEFYFDLEDYDKIKEYCWRESDEGYIVAADRINDVTKIIKMHNIVTSNIERGYEIDHINRIKIDNRKSNLRKLTHIENILNKSLSVKNTSGFIGVGYSKKANKWIANIGYNNKNIFLGYYIDKSDAIRARLLAEKEYFGELSPQQHLFKEYGIE